MISRAASSTEPADRRDVGLRKLMHRDTRRISTQHRKLDTFYAMIAMALELGELPKARAAFLRFQDALDAHFSLEDELYFPAIRGLRPQLDAALAELVREHRFLRKAMQDVGRELERDDQSRSADALEEFVVLLSAHEGREEELLASIERRGSDG